MPASGLLPVGVVGAPAGTHHNLTLLPTGAMLGSKVPAVVAPGGTGTTLGVTAGGHATGTTEMSASVHGGLTPKDVAAHPTSTTTSTAKFLGTPGKNIKEKAQATTTK